MKPSCSRSDHVNRRAFLKGTVLTAGGMVLPNWGALINSPTIAAEAKRKPKRCILLWMAGGASQIDTFDMKPGRPHGGPFRPVATNVSGIHVCEYMPHIARQADKLTVIRSMSTSEGSHPQGTYLMHSGYRPNPAVRHPEIGAICAKYLGDPGADLPSFVQIGQLGGESTPLGSPGFLGPVYQPFRVANGGVLPPNTTPYLTGDADQRRHELLRQLEGDFRQHVSDNMAEAHRLVQEKSVRLLRGKGAFDIGQEWPRYRDQYGDTNFGRNCLTARRLIEAGVPFVEVEHGNYDSHGSNFEWHKALLPVLDRGWSGLLQDLHDRGLLQDTLVIWMGEFGRTPGINTIAGRDHFNRAWTVVLAGGGFRGGLVHGETDPDGRAVRSDMVSEGDLFATIYTALGIRPTWRNFVGVRPIRIAPDDSTPIRGLLN